MRGLKLTVGRLPVVVYPVAPFMGAWIETLTRVDLSNLTFGRTLHGCVDEISRTSDNVKLS